MVLSEFLSEDGTVKWSWELEEGERARLVITTSAGLARYDMADEIEVVGWCHKTPMVRFVGKTGRYLNRVGERVTAGQVSAAMRAIGVDVVGLRLWRCSVLCCNRREKYRTWICWCVRFFALGPEC